MTRVNIRTWIGSPVQIIPRIKIFFWLTMEVDFRFPERYFLKTFTMHTSKNLLHYHDRYLSICRFLTVQWHVSWLSGKCRHVFVAFYAKCPPSHHCPLVSWKSISSRELNGRTRIELAFVIGEPRNHGLFTGSFTQIILGRSLMLRKAYFHMQDSEIESLLYERIFPRVPHEIRTQFL